MNLRGLEERSRRRQNPARDRLEQPAVPAERVFVARENSARHRGLHLGRDDLHAPHEHTRHLNLRGIYWRVIYPGSALIRRMWLRAIERRAMTADRAVDAG